MKIGRSGCKHHQHSEDHFFHRWCSIEEWIRFSTAPGGIVFQPMQQRLQSTLQGIRDAGLYKDERIITSSQSADITVQDGAEVINFCANNYLGLANDPRLIEAASTTMQQHGFGLASVRFICGTQDIHKRLEQRIASFMGTEDTILYSSCFDANGGLFETLLGKEDAIISDQLNHHRSLMAFGCARPSAIALRTMIWQIWKRSFRRLQKQGRVLS